MTIHGLYYFNTEGQIGYFDTPDDPYFLGGTQSAIGQSLFNSNTGIGWHYSNGQEQGDVKIDFDGFCRAQYDATRRLVVAVGEKKPFLASPTNAAVFNEDGTLNHVIALPPYVEHSFDGKTKGHFPPEGFAIVRDHEGKIALGLYFHFQWVQIRVYDPFSGQWGDIIGNYRM